MEVNAKERVVLDVGGKRFATSKSSFLRFKESFFWATLANGHWQPDADGSFFIDRDPKHLLRKDTTFLFLMAPSVEERLFGSGASPSCPLKMGKSLTLHSLMCLLACFQLWSCAVSRHPFL